MNLYQLITPVQWVAGYIGAERKTFFFNCGYCDVVEPVIHAFIGPSPSEVGIIREPGKFFVRHAVLCNDCFQKQLAHTTSATPLNTEVTIKL